MANGTAFSKREIFYEMSTKLHDQMKTSPSLFKAWKGIKTEILPKVFRNGFEPISYIEDSEFYKPLSVFAIDKSKEAGICQKSPKKYLGNLKEMIQHDVGKHDVIVRSIAIEEDQRFAMVPKSNFHLTRVRNNIRREILLQLGGVRKYYTCLPLLRKGDMHIDARYTGIELFIVHEVYCVEQLWISTFGDLPATTPIDENKWEFNGPMPIAFKFKKFTKTFF